MHEESSAVPEVSPTVPLESPPTAEPPAGGEPSPDVETPDAETPADAAPRAGDPETGGPHPRRKTIWQTHGSRILIAAIAVVALASFAVLGLLVRSVLTVNEQPLQSVEERDTVVAVAQAEANPRNADAQAAAANASVLSGDYEQALKYAERAADIDPESPGIQLVKARALQAAGDLTQARAILDKIRGTAEPSSAMYANASLILAVIDEAEGKIPEAIENLKVAQAADPTNADILLQLARLQEQVGLLDDAAASYGEALQYVPDLEPALAALRAMQYGPADYQLAKAAWVAGDQEEARRLMEQAVAESPDVAWLQVALAEFRRMIGDTAGARAAYEAALAIDPGNEEATAGLESLE